jgi:hypothetical protein
MSAASCTSSWPAKRYDRLAATGTGARTNAVLRCFLATCMRSSGRGCGTWDFSIGVPVLNRADARARRTAGLFASLCPCGSRRAEHAAPST